MASTLHIRALASGLLVLGFFVSPPPLHAQATPEAAAVEEVRTRMIDAVRARDVDQLVRYHTHDVVMAFPDGRAVRGLEAFRTFFTDTWSGRTGPNPLQEWPESLDIQHDVALERGGFGPIEAGPVGKYYRVWEKGDDGLWKVRWTILTELEEAAEPAG